MAVAVVDVACRRGQHPRVSTSTEAPRSYTPDDPYDVKGEWIRHDLLALVEGQPKRVLSLGCGTCATELQLQQKGAEVVGLDVSAEAVEVGNRRISKAMVADVETDALTELQPRSFDLVLCGDVLEHLRFTEHVLQRLHGWLADGGALVLSVPNATHYTIVRELLVRRNWRYEDGGLFDRGHYRLFTKKSLLRLLREQGFAVDKVTSIRMVATRMKPIWWLLRPLTWVFRGLEEYFVQNWTVRARVVR
jgi:2-polyprenyl-3-methyl-5-hydroxy-6-metoxy-1,4-benzoquinol methylase